GDGVPQPVEGGSVQPRAAVAVVAEDPLVGQDPPPLTRVRPESLDLLLDRLRLRLPLRRHPRVRRHLLVHRPSPARRASGTRSARPGADSPAATATPRPAPTPMCGGTRPRSPSVAAASRSSSAQMPSDATGSRPAGGGACRSNGRTWTAVRRVRQKWCVVTTP